MGATEALLIAQGAGALAGAGNAATQSSAIRSQGRFQKGMLNENARISERLAGDALSRGREEETRYLRGVRQLAGQQRVAYAAQGVELDSGTPADIIREAQQFGQEDARTIRVNALREAFGYRSQGLGLRTQGRLAGIGSRTAARATLLGGITGAAGDIAGSAALYSSLQAPKAPRATDLAGDPSLY